jgi:hypothetical protein
MKTGWHTEREGGKSAAFAFRLSLSAHLTNLWQRTEFSCQNRIIGEVMQTNRSFRKLT